MSIQGTYVSNGASVLRREAVSRKAPFAALTSQQCPLEYRNLKMSCLEFTRRDIRFVRSSSGELELALRRKSKSGTVLVFILVCLVAAQVVKMYNEGRSAVRIADGRYPVWRVSEQSGDDDNAPSAQRGRFSVSTGNIHDYMPRLLAGEEVSDYELLPCLENFTRATWNDLHKAYDSHNPEAPGGHWFNVLFPALKDAAIGPDPEDQALRNYYIGKAFFASDGAWAEGLATIILAQWYANPVLYSDSSDNLFPRDEAYSLREFIALTIRHSHDNLFGLLMPSSPGRAYPGSIHLGPYPADFPFYYDLIEKNRRVYEDETLGQVTVVETDDLQVTYLKPAQGVYTIIALRAKKSPYQAAGVRIGDTEESLFKHPWPEELKKVDRISHDSEAWFGDGYDYAYAYTPKDVTKSLVFLMRDGLVSGIEIVDDLARPGS